jgi:hypothetical protein
MKPPVNRCLVVSLHRYGESTIRRFNAWPFILSAAFFLPVVTRAQLSLPDPAATRSSASGQFVVINANPASSPGLPPLAVTNTDWVRLNPALLAVSAERIKQPIWRQLGISTMTPWRDRIFLALHPAASSDENVNIISSRFANAWTYRVELPDVVSRTRLTRAITGVVLLELANRDNSGNRSTEIPAWLTEGFAQQLLSDTPEMIMSPPDKLVNGLPQNQVIVADRGVDALAQARLVLHDHPALTFEQLSWPDDGQLRGTDGGVYRASAQLFVSGLLALNDGAANLRAMLQLLPRYYNWQTAFRGAFARDFPQPVDVEKWWALQTINFAARDAGPLWTPAVSSDTLDGILNVPVEMRSAATNLPVHATISLQAVISNFDPDRQAVVLQTKMRDLDRAHWRMAPQFVALTDAYRRALADYLGGLGGGAPASGRGLKHPPVAPPKTSAAETVKKLDALDAQRRVIETAARQGEPANTLH